MANNTLNTEAQKIMESVSDDAREATQRINEQADTIIAKNRRDSDDVIAGVNLSQRFSKNTKNHYF